jgi:hypothetical protein
LRNSSARQDQTNTHHRRSSATFPCCRGVKSSGSCCCAIVSFVHNRTVFLFAFNLPLLLRHDISPMPSWQPILGLHPVMLKMVQDQASRHLATADDEGKRVTSAYPGQLVISTGQPPPALHSVVLKMIQDEASKRHTFAGDECKRVAGACPGLMTVLTSQSPLVCILRC